MLRRRDMAEEEQAPLYPLVNGSKVPATANRGTVTVSNGNHIKLTGKTMSSYCAYVIGDVNNSPDNPNNTSAWKGTPKFFSLKKGDIVDFVVTNITTWVGGGDNTEITVTLRRCSDAAWRAGPALHRTDRPNGKTLTTTISGDVDVFVGMYVANGISALEFDVEVYVNGRRWI